MARLLLGQPLADPILDRLKETIARERLEPGLAVILVGYDPASEIYVRLKREAAERIGVGFELVRLPQDADTAMLEAAISGLNANPTIHGIIVQLPLPAALDADAAIRLIAPAKDADGFHPANLEAYVAGTSSREPVFPRAIALLIQSAAADLSGQPVLAVVNSDLFGRTLVETLKRLGLSAEYVLRDQLAERRDRLRAARVVVTACGVPGLITAGMLSPETIVIDGGVTRLPDGRVVGDTERDAVAATAAAFAPVPGGVGPLTIACLLENVVGAALANKNSPD